MLKQPEILWDKSFEKQDTATSAGKERIRYYQRREQVIFCVHVCAHAHVHRHVHCVHTSFTTNSQEIVHQVVISWLWKKD